MEIILWAYLVLFNTSVETRMWQREVVLTYQECQERQQYLQRDTKYVLAVTPCFAVGVSYNDLKPTMKTACPTVASAGVFRQDGWCYTIEKKARKP